jgi:hypothetical protein
VGWTAAAGRCADSAGSRDGNIALTGEHDVRQHQEFVPALAFGDSLHHALVTMEQALTAADGCWNNPKPEEGNCSDTTRLRC